MAQKKIKGEQEVRKTEIRKKIAENGETNVEFVVDSTRKMKANSENQQDLEKGERNEAQHDAKTKGQQGQQDNISEILINKEMKVKK